MMAECGVCICPNCECQFSDDAKCLLERQVAKVRPEDRERINRMETALKMIRNGWSGSDPLELVRLARAALGSTEEREAERG